MLEFPFYYLEGFDSFVRFWNHFCFILNVIADLESKLIFVLDKQKRLNRYVLCFDLGSVPSLNLYHLRKELYSSITYFELFPAQFLWNKLFERTSRKITLYPEWLNCKVSFQFFALYPSPLRVASASKTVLYFVEQWLIWTTVFVKVINWIIFLFFTLFTPITRGVLLIYQMLILKWLARPV